MNGEEVVLLTCSWGRFICCSFFPRRFVEAGAGREWQFCTVFARDRWGSSVRVRFQEGELRSTELSQGSVENLKKQFEVSRQVASLPQLGVGAQSQ